MEMRKRPSPTITRAPAKPCFRSLSTKESAKSRSGLLPTMMWKEPVLALWRVESEVVADGVVRLAGVEAVGLAGAEAVGLAGVTAAGAVAALGLADAGDWVADAAGVLAEPRDML